MSQMLIGEHVSGSNRRRPIPTYSLKVLDKMNPNLIWGPLKIVESVRIVQVTIQTWPPHSSMLKKDLQNILLQFLKAYNSDPSLTLNNLRPRQKPLSHGACDRRATSRRLSLFVASATIPTTFLLLK